MTLAIDGGTPVRQNRLPYGRQQLDDDDLRAVVDVLRSEYLTTGPTVAAFERACAELVGAPECVAVSSGTAALHAAYCALGIGPGDEVIVPAMTFAATANAVLYLGATPVFADVDPETLLADPRSVEARLGPRTRAVVAVDYAGQPCDYAALASITQPRELPLVADACHALGGRDERGQSVGSLADLSTFSFHPVKAITSGEGGMICALDPARAKAMRVFRNHGITTDHRQRELSGAFAYEMVTLGWNYRLTDIQCALGLAQLRKLPSWTARRKAIAARYDQAFAAVPAVRPLRQRPGVESGHHLYVVKLSLERLRVDRAAVYHALRAEGIGVNVHYLPVHLHPYYRERLRTGRGLCPAAEAAYERILTLPLYPAMTDADTDDVIAAVRKVVSAYAR